jgi:predicted membrane GTPase involved in stress response
VSGALSAARLTAVKPWCCAKPTGTTDTVRISPRPVSVRTVCGARSGRIRAHGDLVCVSGIADINIGDTACHPDCVEPLPFVNIDEPTISMNFIVIRQSFAGREGKFVTSRNLRDPHC